MRRKPDYRGGTLETPLRQTRRLWAPFVVRITARVPPPRRPKVATCRSSKVPMTQFTAARYTLAIAMKTDRNDPQGYRRIVKRREGPFRDCVHIGNIPIKESSHRDLYDLVDRLIKYRQVAIECYREQLGAAHDKATGNRRRARLYRKTIAELEAEQQIVTEAFRAFMQEYPDAAASTKRTAASDEREARQARKRVQKGLGDINKLMD
jgi:hypothetical protein